MFRRNETQTLGIRTANVETQRLEEPQWRARRKPCVVKAEWLLRGALQLQATECDCCPQIASAVRLMHPSPFNHLHILAQVFWGYFPSELISIFITQFPEKNRNFIWSDFRGI